MFTEGELALHRAEGRNEEEMRKQGDRLPLGRIQTPLDAAYAVVYLLSDESSQVTGMILNVDAGAATLPLPQGFYPG